MNTRRGRGKGSRPQSAVAIADNPTTISSNSRRGVNQGRGEPQRATSSGTPAAAAGSKRGASSRGSQPTRNKLPRQDNSGGSFLTRDDIPAIIEAVRRVSSSTFENVTHATRHSHIRPPPQHHPQQRRYSTKSSVSNNLRHTNQYDLVHPPPPPSLSGSTIIITLYVCTLKM